MAACESSNSILIDKSCKDDCKTLRKIFYGNIPLVKRIYKKIAKIAFHSLVH